MSASCHRSLSHSLIAASRLRQVALAAVLAGALTWAPAGSAAEKKTFTTAASEAAGKVWTGAQDVTLYALSLIGVRYKFGGNTPETGLDCSGLVRYVFQEVTGISLPRTSKEMGTVGAKVGVADLMPGDLVFFNTRRFANSHVGIYLGDNRFIHAPSKGGDVEIATMNAAYWQKRFTGARRLVETAAALSPSIVSSAQAAEITFSPAPLSMSFAQSMVPDRDAPLAFAPQDITP